MNENVPHNIDNAFRTKIEQMSLQAPSLNLDGVRANILQRNLQSSQFQNRWLKGSLIAMSLLLGSCVYMLMNRNDDIDKTLTHEKIIKVVQTDTVYITKYQTKIIKVPEPNYPKTSQTLDKYTKIIKPNYIIDDKNFTNGLPDNHAVVSNKVSKTNETPKYFSLNKTKNKQLSDNQEIEIGFDRNKTIENTIKETVTTGSIENSIENQKIQLLSYDFLKSKSYRSNIVWETLPIKYNSPIKPSIKPQKITIPFLDRLSLGVYFSPEDNNLDLRRDAIQAFGLGDEEISNSSNLGIRLGFKINPKISILTAVEMQTMNFIHTGIGREKVTAESGIDGKPIFLRYTVFGVAQIPLTNMTANPQVGSSVLVEGDNGHFTSAIRIPLSFKIQFYERTLLGLGWRGAGINLYAIGGAYYAIPTKQQLMTEVYEPNGEEFHTTLKNFTNINPYTGYNLGIGGEFSYGQHFQFFIEPYYQSTIKSLVNDMPIRTYVNGIGVKFGVNYQFSKK